uniref:Orf214 n=1 Tax=Schizophyllum commune TaxID=5334 RepID=Q94ZJ0_SCHCO|nr:orf214 [Schizophyllum commune]AAK83407.1 orf214 [Schizophyllum commune]
MKFLLSFLKIVALPFTYLSKLDQIPKDMYIDLLFYLFIIVSIVLAFVNYNEILLSVNTLEIEEERITQLENKLNLLEKEQLEQRAVLSQNSDYKIATLIDEENELTKNFFSFGLDSIFSRYSDYLLTLSDTQLISYINILFCISLIYNGFNLLICFFGNKLIYNLNLSIKFPKLAKLLAHRQKQNKFRIWVYTCTSILFLFGQLFTNIYLIYLG